MDCAELWYDESLDLIEVAEDKCSADELAPNVVAVVVLGRADVTLSVATDASCVVLCVIFNDVLFERSLLSIIVCVVETFETDRLGLLSGEVPMLSLILLLEVRTGVGDTLGVNAPEKRVVSADLVDKDLLKTTVLVSSGRDKFVLTVED